MRFRYLALALCASVPLFSTRPAAAQVSIACEPPLQPAANDACSATVGLPDEIQRQVIRLWVTAGGQKVVGQAVRFRGTSGTFQPDTAITDSDGFATTLWFRNQGKEPVGIAAEVQTPHGSAVRYIQFTPTPAVPAVRVLDIACEPPLVVAGDGTCRGQVALPDSNQQQIIRVRVTSNGVNAAGQTVRFAATAGTVQPDSSKTDAGGLATTLWYRNRGADPVGIAAYVQSAQGATVRYIQLAPTSSLSRLRYHSGDRQHWYEKSSLRYPLVVEVQSVNPATDKASAIVDSIPCATHRVVLTRSGASGFVTPDTAIPRILQSLQYGNAKTPAERLAEYDRMGCFVEANWTLGDGAGYRHARATLLGPAVQSTRANVQFQAVSRALPKVIAGLSFGWTPGYDGRQAGTERTIGVERVFPDGTTVTYDSTVTSRDTVDAVPTDFAFAPVVGVSAAVWPSQNWLSLTAGVDVRDPDDNWYLGVSLPRFGGRLGAESLPVDLHLLVHWGRTPQLKNRARCVSAGECETDKVARFHGISLMGSVDAASLLTEVIKTIGVP